MHFGQLTVTAEMVRALVDEQYALGLPPRLAPGRSSALLRVAAQGVWVPVLRWCRTMATASRWVSPEPAENA
jgi:hypothetical protein